MFSMFKSTSTPQTTVGRDLNAEQLTQVTGGCAKTVAAPPAQKHLAPHQQPAPIHHVAPAQPQAPARPVAPAAKPTPKSGC